MTNEQEQRSGAWMATVMANDLEQHLGEIEGDLDGLLEAKLGHTDGTLNGESPGAELRESDGDLDGESLEQSLGAQTATSMANHWGQSSGAQKTTTSAITGNSAWVARL